MSENQNQNRRRRRHSHRNKDKPREEPRNEREAPPCCVCGKPIRDILSALLHATTGEPAHFDCVMQQLLAEETLAEGEKFTYLGSGIFGIVRQGRSTDPSSIVIRKKIQYEDKEKAAAWRREFNIKV